MRLTRIAALIITLCMLSTVAAWADSEPQPRAEAKAVHKVATYAFPELSPELVRSLSKALSKHEGVLQAKVEKEDNHLAVFFDPQTTNADAISTTLKEHAQEIKLVKVDEAPAASHDHKDCGKCPHKKSCDKAGK